MSYSQELLMKPKPNVNYWGFNNFPSTFNTLYKNSFTTLKGQGQKQKNIESDGNVYTMSGLTPLALTALTQLLVSPGSNGAPFPGPNPNLPTIPNANIDPYANVPAQFHNQPYTPPSYIPPSYTPPSYNPPTEQPQTETGDDTLTTLTEERQHQSVALTEERPHQSVITNPFISPSNQRRYGLTGGNQQIQRSYSSYAISSATGPLTNARPGGPTSTMEQNIEQNIPTSVDSRPSQTVRNLQNNTNFQQSLRPATFLNVGNDFENTVPNVQPMSRLPPSFAVGANDAMVHNSITTGSYSIPFSQSTAQGSLASSLGTIMSANVVRAGGPSLISSVNTLNLNNVPPPQVAQNPSIASTQMNNPSVGTNMTDTPSLHTRNSTIISNSSAVPNSSMREQPQNVNPTLNWDENSMDPPDQFSSNDPGQVYAPYQSGQPPIALGPQARWQGPSPFPRR